MTISYKSRKEMLDTETFPTTNNLSEYSREEIKERYTKETGGGVWFNVVATSSGLYGVNGAVIDVWSDMNTEEPYTTFYIKERNFTLLEFV